MKIDINKKYRTRDGREAIIHTLTGPRIGFPVIASIQDTDANGSWMSHDFTDDGRYLESVRNTCGNDLIEVREPREWTLRGNPCGAGCIVEDGPSLKCENLIRVREIID